MTATLTTVESIVRRRLPRGDNPAAIARSRRYLAEGVFESPQFGDVAFSDGALWTDQADRSRARFAHGFLWFADWPDTAAADPELARAAHSLTTRWLARTAEWRTDPTSMAFHDETTAQRLTMHLALIEGLRSLLVS